jgi:hypothetical protein
MIKGATTIIIMAILLSGLIAESSAAPARVGVPSPSASYFPLIVAS